MSISPLSDALREVNAAECGITDVTLSRATNLVILNASGNSSIRTVAPFAQSLLELEVTGNSGLTDGALTSVTNLVSLNASRNNGIQSLLSFAASLRHLNASESAQSLTNTALQVVTQLVTLDRTLNVLIDTVVPFSNTLCRVMATCLDLAPLFSRLYNLFSCNSL